MAPLLVIAALVALAWSVVYVRQTGLLGASAAVLLVGSCFGHAFFNYGMLTLDRVLVVVLAGATAALWLRGDLAIPKLTRADYLLLAFVGYLGLNTLAHDWRAYGMKSAVTLVLFYGLPLAMYFVARAIPQTARGLAGYLWFLTAFGLYLGLTAVAEWRGMHGFVFPRYIASPQYWEFLGRGRGPYLNPCANGLYLTVGASAALLLWPRARGAAKVAAAGAASMGIIGVFATLTRCVWIGSGLAWLIVVVAQAPRRWRAPLVAGAVVIAALVLVTKWQDLQAFKRDKHVSAEGMAQSAPLRPMLAAIAWRMFEENPVFGCGFGQYLTAAKPIFSERFSSLPVEQAKPYVQHNIFLSLLTETGLIGLLCYVAVLAAWSRMAWRLWSDSARSLVERQQGLLLAAALISYVTSGMFQDMTIIAMVHMMMFVQAGITRGLLATAPERKPVPRPVVSEAQPAPLMAGTR
jgi:O-antigen ligase